LAIGRRLATCPTRHQPPLKPVPIWNSLRNSLTAEAQIDRILRSNTFRSAEGLRKLLRFLADRLAAGDADQLKEYSVGIDGLGKRADYDPRQDSTVRIQVGRLRHKLADYYRSEGLDDPYIVEIPKGHFKLSLTPRPVSTPTVVERPTVPTQTPTRPFLMWGLAGGLLIAIAWAAVASVQLRREQQTSAVFRSMWTPGLEQLWEPFLSARRPVIVAIEDPPFAQFSGYGVYREMNLNSWADIEKSARIAQIRKLLGNPDMTPSHYYAPVGEVSAAFLLGRLLGPRVPALSLSVVRDLSWQQLASHNVIYVGASVFFTDRFNALPAAIDFDYDYARGGIEDAHPGPGEPAFYPEQLQNASESGELYAIVTHVPGPSGSGDVTSFTSMRTPSRLGAVQWFTDPAHATELAGKMKNSAGRMPRYYQVLLKVKFKDSVPTQISYVLHHDLNGSGRSK
jgi:hypothetical protein